jgi:hypothetical protein
MAHGHGMVEEVPARPSARGNTALAYRLTPCLGTFNGQRARLLRVDHIIRHIESRVRKAFSVHEIKPYTAVKPYGALCSFSCSSSRRAAERRRRGGADHPELLLARPHAAIGRHALCGHRTRAYDHHSRRHQGLELVPHCQLTMRTSMSAKMATCSGCSSQSARYGCWQWLCASSMGWARCAPALFVCSALIEARQSPLAPPCVPRLSPDRSLSVLVMLARKSGLEISCNAISPNPYFMKCPSQLHCDPITTRHDMSAHPISAVVILSGPSLADLMQENISTIHGFCTRSVLFVCCVAHPRSDLSTLVCTSGVHELSLLPHGDVVRLCVADDYHLVATAGDPSCEKTSTNALWFRVILISALCLLYPVRPFCSTFRELRTQQLFTAPPSIVSPGVAVSVSHTRAH